MSMADYNKRQIIILALKSYRGLFKKNSPAYKEISKILEEDYSPKGYTEEEIEEIYGDGEFPG